MAQRPVLVKGSQDAFAESFAVGIFAYKIFSIIGVATLEKRISRITALKKSPDKKPAIQTLLRDDQTDFTAVIIPTPIFRLSPQVKPHPFDIRHSR